jgi:Rieske Fe-S protein
MDTARRAILGGACCGAAGVAALLAGCDVLTGDRGTATHEAAVPAGSPGTVLAQTSTIPLGGGSILDDRGIVVTQPTQGMFVAFSATCPHVGCTVTSVSDGTINCGCHGSKFRLADGSVVNGPATQGLTPVRVTIDGTDVKLA